MNSNKKNDNRALTPQNYISTSTKKGDLHEELQSSVRDQGRYSANHDTVHSVNTVHYQVEGKQVAVNRNINKDHVAEKSENKVERRREVPKIHNLTQ